MLKILQARLQQYFRRSELPGLQARFRKKQRNQGSNCQHLLVHQTKQESSRNASTSALWTMSKTLTVWITKLWKILKEMGILDHLTCHLRNLYEVQETTVRTGCGKTDCFQTVKGVCQGYILSTCLFNLYAEYIMRNASLDEAEAGINTSVLSVCNQQHQ